jgi:hypothetical protein
MTDHHDFGDHHYDDHHYDDYDRPDLHHDDQPFDDLPDHDLPDHPDPLDHPEHHADLGHDPHHDTPPETEHHIPATDDAHLAGQHHDGQHHDTTTYDDDPAPADVFPPPVDVGELPEPVDGFPWTDAATLGTADLTTLDTTQPVDPHELAEYAGTEIPPGADPWAVLAASDDPATSTLARFWHDTAE